MEAIDQAQFNFSPTVGLAVSVMVGFLVFAVALDLTWDEFHRILKRPRAPLIGLVAQYLILPGAAFGVGLTMVATPSSAQPVVTRSMALTHDVATGLPTLRTRMRD
jgi:bile acid:Na+ symporter, BASS family